MNTNTIKSFARQARTILLDGVTQRLRYWGFDAKGDNELDLQTTTGGYIFRGQVFTDTSVPAAWNKLKKRLTSKQAVQDVVEEAAYVWFNRLMAVKILEENGYLPPQLRYTEGMRTPLLVQNAKKGQHGITRRPYVELLTEYLREDKEEEAFGLLLTRLCHNHSLLQDVFGRIDDYTEILLPQNLLQSGGLMDLINSEAIPADDYREVELIGWLYQFYISDKKDDVFAGFKQGKKARAEDIPAATQIFTPKWIVKYMVENTVGKLYLDYEPHSELKADMKYLVRDEGEGGRDEGVGQSPQTPNPYSPTPTPQPLISDLTELTLLDPAAGSGHILVTGFELLFTMYREAGYTARNAVESILKHNLFGLDIDDRARQLARFAVLLKAASYDASILDKGIMPHIYSFPEPALEGYLRKEMVDTTRLHDEFKDALLWQNVNVTREDTIKDEKTGREKTVKVTERLFNKGTLIASHVASSLVEEGIKTVDVGRLVEIRQFLDTDAGRGDLVIEVAEALTLLRKGKNLGSTLKVELSPEARSLVEKQYQLWQQKHQAGSLTIQETSLWNTLCPYLEVLLVLSRQYGAVVANPPYMGQKSMNGPLKDYVNAQYPRSKSDLMTVFMEVIPNLTLNGSRFALINLPSWLFLSSFEKLRDDYLEYYQFDSLLHMGRGIFGIDFGSVAFAMKKVKTDSSIGSYFRLHERNFQHIHFNDIEKLFLYSNGNEDYRYNFSSYRDEDGVTEIPKQGTLTGERIFYPNKSQTNFSKIPGNPIAYWLSDDTVTQIEEGINLGDISTPRSGMSTTNNTRFLRFWQEVSKVQIGYGYSLQADADQSGAKWIPYNKGGGIRWLSELEYVVNWLNNGAEIKEWVVSNPNDPRTTHWSRRIFNTDFFYRNGITWGDVSSGVISVKKVKNGYIFDSVGISLFDLGDNENVCIALLNSSVGKFFLGLFCPTIHFNPGGVSRVPFLNFDQNRAEISLLVECNINISKSYWDSHETSWDFQQSYLLNGASSLKQAYQHWGAAATQDFFQLHAHEEELNRIFIDIYGLQEELTPEVPLKDITILQEELDRNALEQDEIGLREQGLGIRAKDEGLSLVPEGYRLPISKAEVMSQFVSYAIGVLLGRYHLVTPGLHIAHPNATEEELREYVVIGGKGLGPVGQKESLKHLLHAHPELSRSIGLAKIDGSGDNRLPSDQPVSAERTIRSDQSTSESSSIRPVQYSGGPSTGDQGISSISENSEGLTGGSGDTTGNSLSAELPGIRASQGTDGTNYGVSQNAERPHAQPHSLIPDPPSLIPIKIDEDAILPLLGDDGAFPDDALLRTKDMILAIWGEDTLTENLNFLHEGLGMNLHKWLTEKFWGYHTSMYKKKPIYWLFCSNPKKPHQAAFRVLVYMHRMDKYTVGKIQRQYLHPHQEYIRHEIQRLADQENSLGKSELKRLETLRSHQIECRDYNEVLKELSLREIEFDLDDGVDVNYAKFEGAVAKI